MSSQVSSARQKKWIIKDVNGRVHGPYSTRALLESISEGKVNEEDRIARYPGGEWQAISKNLEFYDRLLETLAQEAQNSRAAQNKDKEKDGAPEMGPTLPGKIYLEAETATKDDFVMTPPRPLPNEGAAAEHEPELSRISEQENPAEDSNVIDLEDKSKIVRLLQLNRIWKPMLVLAILVSLGAFFLWPTTPTGRVHLRPPEDTGTTLGQTAFLDALTQAKRFYFMDTFEGYWQAQNRLITLIPGHRNSLELNALLCLVYRELWPYTYQDRTDTQIFSDLAYNTRKRDPAGKNGMICEAAFALSQGQHQKAQNIIETALPQNVREPVFYEMRASIWGGQQQYASAVDYLRTIQNLAPNWIKPYRLQASYLVSLNRIPEAIQALQALLKKSPKHDIGNIEMGVLIQQHLNKDQRALQHIVLGFQNSKQLPPLVKVQGYKSMAKIYFKEGNKSKALKYYEMAYQINPNDVEIQSQLKSLGGKEMLKTPQKDNDLLALAEHYERQGDCFAAQAEYRAVFESNPKNARAAFKAASCLWKISQAKEALEWLDKALAVDPEYIEAYVKKSEFYAERYDFLTASRVLQRAIKIAPKNHLVFQGLARLQLKRNDYAAAVAYAQKAVELFQTDVESAILLVKALLGQKSYGKAYEKAVELRSFDPANPQVQEAYIRALAAVQNLESAITVVRELIEQYPYTIEYRFLYGQLLKEDERYAGAEEALRNVLQFDEKHKFAMLELAHVLQAQGKFNEARDLYLNAAIQDPSDAEALFSLGQLYLKAGNAKSALDQFERVLRNNPLYPNAHYFSGRAALLARNFNRALEEAQKEAKMNPHRADPHILMGDIYFYLRDYANCISSYQKAIKLREPTSDLYISQARCYRLLGGLDTSLQLLRTAELKEPGNPLVWKEMGAVCEMKENKDCAIEAYRQYLNLAPNASDRKFIEDRVLKILEPGM